MSFRRSFWPLLLGLAFQAGGGVLEGSVVHTDGHYLVHFDILIESSLERVLPLVRDYPNLPRISPRIQSVEMLTPPGEDPAIMRVKSRFCVLFVCKELNYVQRVKEHPPAHILAEMLPGEGDLRFGRVSYRFEAAGKGTRLTLDGDIVPAFWVPPWIGPLLIRRALAKEAEAIAHRLETLAHGP